MGKRLLINGLPPHGPDVSKREKSAPALQIWNASRLAKPRELVTRWSEKPSSPSSRRDPNPMKTLRSVLRNSVRRRRQAKQRKKQPSNKFYVLPFAELHCWSLKKKKKKKKKSTLVDTTA